MRVILRIISFFAMVMASMIITDFAEGKEVLGELTNIQMVILGIGATISGSSREYRKEKRNPTYSIIFSFVFFLLWGLCFEENKGFAVLEAFVLTILFTLYDYLWGDYKEVNENE